MSIEQDIRNAVAGTSLAGDKADFDNVAIALCSFFEDVDPSDGEQDESGWSIWATNKYNLTMAAVVESVAAVLNPLLDAQRARIAALESHQRWRSVAEGLPPAGESPKYSDEVEIVFRDSNQAHRTIGCYCFMDQSWRDNDDRRLWVPTHWREIGPLPDLPAKGNE